MDKRLLHPDMLNELDNFFSQTCTIQENAPTEGEGGEPVPSWSDKEDHVDIPCAIGSSGGKEIKRSDATYTISTHTILLQGYYSGIDETMQAVVLGKSYDILLADSDSRFKMTRLLCRKVE